MICTRTIYGSPPYRGECLCPVCSQQRINNKLMGHWEAKKESDYKSPIEFIKDIMIIPKKDIIKKDQEIKRLKSKVNYLLRKYKRE